MGVGGAARNRSPRLNLAFGRVVRPHCQHPSGPPAGWNLVVPTTCKSRRGLGGRRPRRGRPEPPQGRPIRPRASAVQAGATRAAVDHSQDPPRVALTIRTGRSTRGTPGGGAPPGGATSDPSGLTVGHNGRVKVDPVLMTVALARRRRASRAGDSGASWPAAILRYLPATIVDWRWPRCHRIACARSCVEGGGRMCSTRAIS